MKKDKAQTMVDNIIYRVVQTDWPTRTTPTGVTIYALPTRTIGNEITTSPHSRWAQGENQIKNFAVTHFVQFMTVTWPLYIWWPFHNCLCFIFKCRLKHLTLIADGHFGKYFLQISLNRVQHKEKEICF
jgi:hypothetical protein